jgi:predicted DNA-binding antitoxin AbrB/MazE fold protein
MTIRAVYEKGVFRPTEKVEFPDHCEVEIEVRQVKPKPQVTQPPMSEGLAKVYEILGRQHNSGCPDTAERHNEHQP